MTEAAFLRLWRYPDGRYQWAYAEPERGLELVSNRTFDSLDDARRAARAAYPGVPIASAPVEEEPQGNSARRVHPLWALAAFVLLAWVAWGRRSSRAGRATRRGPG